MVAGSTLVPPSTNGSNSSTLLLQLTGGSTPLAIATTSSVTTASPAFNPALQLSITAVARFSAGNVVQTFQEYVSSNGAASASFVAASFAAYQVSP